METVELCMAKSGIEGRLVKPVNDLFEGKVLLILGGGDGDYDWTTEVAERFALEGITTFALCYFRAEGLPYSLEMVDVNYVKKACEWLKDEGYEKIGVWGISMGAQYALLSAVTYPELLSAVILASPISFATQGVISYTRYAEMAAFSKDGKPFEYTPFSGRMKKLSLISNCMRRKEFTVRFMYDEIMDDIREESIIPAEKMKAPLLMFTALDDSMWPSYESAKSIMKRLEENRYAYKRIHVTYRHGSHFMLPLELGAEKVFFNERAFKRINRRIRADILERTMSFLEQYWK